MKSVKSILEDIIEHAGGMTPACKDCKSYRNGGCSFGCVNERLKMTAPNYSCGNFSSMYEYDDKTVSVMRELLEDIKRTESGVRNLELLMSGKIDEKEFVDFVG